MAPSDVMAIFFSQDVQRVYSMSMHSACGSWWHKKTVKFHRLEGDRLQAATWLLRSAPIAGDENDREDHADNREDLARTEP